MADTAQLRKLRGAFFTPLQIADFLTDWAVRSPTDSILEPSCGEAIFLLAASRRLQALKAGTNLRKQLHGIDVHAESVENAAAILKGEGFHADLHVGDFFETKPAPQFDVVLGNPPYVRYQNFMGDARMRGRKAALAQGVHLDGLASSWAAFVVHAAACLNPSGRLALVLPAELLSVNYAGPVRRFLMERFEKVRLVLFEELVFPGVLEEVVLLLAEGTGPTKSCDLYQARNLSDLARFEAQPWQPASVEGKWSSALLPKDAASLYSQLSQSASFCTLQTWGETTLGMVTGNNDYFTLTAEQAQKLRIPERELTRISPPSSKHLRGLSFTGRAWEDMAKLGSRVFLFDPDPDKLSGAASAYIRAGELRKVHKAYKCSVRNPWWRVPRVGVPDLFLTYMNHDTPRLVTNKARVPYLNSIHGLFLSDKFRRLASDLLPIAALNSMTLLGAEVVGRSYGGGMLKLEPKEADQLPVPSPEIVEKAAAQLRAVRPQLALHLRQGELLEAAKVVDRILLLKGMRLTSDQLETLREGRKHMFERRVARGKQSK